MTLIQQDLYQARDIPPRLPVWESVAFRGANNSDAGGPGELFLFTRTNHTFFRPDQASPYLRVAYRLQDETLYRVTWPRLNVSTDSEGAEAGLLDGVTGIQLRYMDNTRQWITSWPQALNTRGPAGLPRAVELTLELQDHESYQRVFHVGAAY
jgi:general secretion pathway protein J